VEGILRDARQARSDAAPAQRREDPRRPQAIALEVGPDLPHGKPTQVCDPHELRAALRRAEGPREELAVLAIGAAPLESRQILGAARADRHRDQRDEPLL